MAERFYVPALGNDALAKLVDDEAHHLARVRRIRAGERVQLFDGSGIECDAIVREIGRNEVTLQIERRQAVSRELPFDLTLACAPAKGDRLRWLVEKATELGVTRFVPVLTQRSSEEARRMRAEKTSRWVIAASKQCGRNVLMEVLQPVRWDDLVRAIPDDTVKLCAHPAGDILGPIISRPAGSVAVAVGPEGGFTDEELESARRRGWAAVRLGPRTLRVETAVVSLVARVVGDE